MKKTLAILMVAIIAVGSVFAGVKLSGEFGFGYEMNFDDGFHAYRYGQDGNDSAAAKFNIKGTDDDGIFSVTLRSIDDDDERVFNQSGQFEAFADVDLSKALAKAYDLEMPVTLKVSGGYLYDIAGNRADADLSDKHWARVKTVKMYSGISAEIGYDKYVKVTVAGDPAKDNAQKIDNREFMVNAIVTPVDGVAVAGTYARLSDQSGNDGAFNVATKVDVQKLADLDFSVVASAAYRYNMSTEKSSIAATVSTGFDKFGIDAEYAIDFGGKDGNDDTVNKFYLAANTGIVENVDLGAYIICTNVEEFGDSFEVGATAGYSMGNIGLNLKVGYVGFDGNTTGAKLPDLNFDKKGFNITPSFSVSF